MVSTFTWLDHSDRERQRVLEAIERFNESDTRDGFGLGGIRDAIAGLFFPGTSVIQTRARYFLLFVPRLYLDLEARNGEGGSFVALKRLSDALGLAQGGEAVELGPWTEPIHLRVFRTQRSGDVGHVDR
ncbi:DUF6361 family protein [Sorangium sp. So ce117]|uniref:DUF6361 family protein n=1 Tax=Sorangium sp. So ce117 TaxID=3133277 RepID=UPI003F6248AA